MTDWQHQFPSTSLTRTYRGDQEYGKRFDGEANKLLYELKNHMTFNSLGQLTMKRVIKTDDGPVLVTASSHFGYDKLHIDTSRAEALIRFYDKYLTLATFDIDEMKVYFQIGKSDADTVAHHFYIDLTEIFSDLGHTSSTAKVFALSLVEYHPQLGALFYLVNGDGDEEISKDGYVIKFEVKEKTSPENIETYDGKDYTQHDFDYEVDTYDLSDSTISEVVPGHSCTTESYNGAGSYTLQPDIVYGTPWEPDGEPNHPYGWTVYPSYEVPYTITDRLGSYSWSKEVTYNFYDIPQISIRFLGNEDVVYASELSVTVDSAIFSKVWLDGYPSRAIKPIGASCWTEGGDTLGLLKWGIHFYCIGEFQATKQVTEIFSITPGIVNIDSPDDPPISYTFDIAGAWGMSENPDTDTYTEESEFQVPFILYRTDSGLTIEDRFELWAKRWNVDYFVDAGYSSGVIDRAYYTPNRYSYKRTHAIRNLNGYPPVYLYEYSDRKDVGGVITEVFKIETPSGVYDLGTFTGDANTYWTIGPDAHAGGGNYARVMTRVDTAFYDESDDFDRSIYIISGNLYDYDDDLPVDYSLGRASRELLIDQEYYNMSYPAIIDSDYNSTSQRYTFTAKDGTYTLTQINDKFGMGLYTDGGILNKEFFYLK